MKTQSSNFRSWGGLAAALGFLVVASAPVRADYQSTVLGDNPLAYYALTPASDPASDSPDLSGNGNDGYADNLSATNGPSAYIPNAAYFNGSSAFVDLSFGNNPDLLNFSGPITMEAWVQPSSSGEFADIIAKGYDSSTYQEIVIRVNGPYGANYYASSGSAGESGGAQTTSWTHVVLSSDGTKCSLYVNGGLAGRSADTSGSQTFGDDWIIGNGSSAGSSRPFAGNICQVAIYNHGLTEAQVRTHYLMGLYGTTNVSSRNLKWSALGSSGSWDTNSTDWINLSNSSATAFQLGDSVLFDDTTGAATNVVINNDVLPGAVVVNSSTNAYTINGPDRLTGSTSFTKLGSSYLTVVSPGYFTGPAIIGGGTVYAGNNSFDFASSMVISNGAMIDVGGGSLALNMPVTVSGSGVNNQGAIVNSYGSYPSESLNITLAGDTKFGGTARWDLASGSHISGAHNLVLDWSAGAGYSQWNSVVLDAAIGGIFVTNNSQLGMNGNDSSCANSNTLITLSPNCQMIYYGGGFNGSIHAMSGSTVNIYTAPAPFTGANLIFDDNSAWVSYYNSGANTPITSAVTLNGVVHFVVGDHLMMYSNVFSGPGGFVLDYYNNGVQFSSANTYTGPTVIGSSGNTPEIVLTGNGSISHSSLIFMGGADPNLTHIDASARTDGKLTIASGQTLAGVGHVVGDLAVASGATISPAGTNTTISITTGANATGGITASGAVTLGGSTVMKLNGSGVNDQITAGSSMTLGGTLTLVNVGPALANGNSFQLFSAGNTGSFSSISPATPGSNLHWDLSQLNSTGSISVVANPQPNITSTSVFGGNIILSGSGGVANATFYVLTTTNLQTSLMNWKKVSTNAFSGTGTFSVTNAIQPGANQQFYLIDQSQ